MFLTLGLLFNILVLADDARDAVWDAVVKSGLTHVRRHFNVFINCPSHTLSLQTPAVTLQRQGLRRPGSAVLSLLAFTERRRRHHHHHHYHHHHNLSLNRELGHHR